MWFAFQGLYLFDRKPDGKNVFEERIVCFEADTLELASAKADKESEDYAKANRLDVIGSRFQIYQQDGDPLIDGYEVWSMLFESRDTPEEFYANRYLKYEYHPY